MIETTFQIVNMLVLPQWLLMIFAPRWVVTQWLMRSYLIPVLLACFYAYYIFSGKPLNFADFSSFEGVKSLFANGGEAAMLAGWIHYLAFDLVAGTAVLQDAQAKKIAHGWVVIPLFFCFMLGPTGFFLYWIIRTVQLRKVA